MKSKSRFRVRIDKKRCKGCELSAAGHYCMDDDSIYRRYADAAHRGNDELCHEIAHEMLTALREGRAY